MIYTCIGSADIVKEIQTESGVKCGTFAASSIEDRHLATGNYDGKLVVYDLEQPSKDVSQHTHIHTYTYL